MPQSHSFECPEGLSTDGMPPSGKALAFQPNMRADACLQDVKPDNIYRTAEGVLKVGDFGLAVLKNPNRASGFQWVSWCSMPCTDVMGHLCHADLE